MIIVYKIMTCAYTGQFLVVPHIGLSAFVIALLIFEPLQADNVIGGHVLHWDHVNLEMAIKTFNCIEVKLIIQTCQTLSLVPEGVTGLVNDSDIIGISFTATMKEFWFLLAVFHCKML